jgi:hypothetical protein
MAAFMRAGLPTMGPSGSAGGICAGAPSAPPPGLRLKLPPPPRGGGSLSRSSSRSSSFGSDKGGGEKSRQRPASRPRSAPRHRALPSGVVAGSGSAIH